MILQTERRPKKLSLTDEDLSANTASVKRRKKKKAEAEDLEKAQSTAKLTGDDDLEEWGFPLFSFP